MQKSPSEKINVAYVIWSLGLGGAEQVIMNLAKGLNKNRYNVMVCCLNDPGVFAENMQQEGISVVAIHKKPGVDLSVIPKLIRIFKENKIDIVHTHLWGANVWGRIAAKLAFVKVTIATEHNVDVWKKWYHQCIDRVLANFCDQILVVSGEVKRFYATEIKIPANKIKIIYNGIAPSPKRKNADANAELRKEFGIRTDAIVLSNIGRLVEAKANHIFIQALEILSHQGLKFHGLVVGDGPLKASLVSQGKHLTRLGQLTFTGLRKDMDRILEITDISVLSSTREGFSIVILESMAKGIPVVATDVGGNSELVLHGKTGLLVDQGSAVSLANALLEVIDKKLIAAMGQAGFERVGQLFSLENMIRQTEDVYEQLLAG